MLTKTMYLIKNTVKIIVYKRKYYYNLKLMPFYLIAILRSIQKNLSSTFSAKKNISALILCESSNVLFCSAGANESSRGSTLTCWIN